MTQQHPLEQWLEKKKRAGQPVRKRQLASAVACSPARITQIAHGEEPSLALAAKLSRVTGIPVEAFAKREGGE